MSIFTKGSWACGCVHTIIDDNARQPSPQEIMAWFLKMSEEQFIDSLAKEIETGTLSKEQAERILNGYLKKRTFNAYEGR